MIQNVAVAQRLKTSDTRCIDGSGMMFTLCAAPKWRKEERREGNKWCDNGLHVDHVEDSGAAGLPGAWEYSRIIYSW